MAIVEAHRGGLFGRLLRGWTRRSARAAVSALSAAEIETLLTEFHALKEQAAPLIRQLEKLKPRVDEIPEGRYGAMRLRRGRSHPRFDQTAGRARLAELKQEIPMMTVRGRTTVERVA